jgi:hypothetical protein
MKLCIALCLLAAAPAGAQERWDGPRFDFRLGISGGWFLNYEMTPPYDTERAGGIATIEMGVGFRATRSFAFGVFGRVGLLHYGAGVEATTAPFGGWTSDGLVFRIGVSAMRDATTCGIIPDDEGGNCSTATYLLAEVGPQYRWASGFSLGFAVIGGAQKLSGSKGDTTKFAWGALGPRLQGEF